MLPARLTRSPRALVLAGAALIVLAAAAILWLQGDAADRKADEVAYLRIDAHGHVLGTVVLEAAVGERSPADARREVKAIAAEMDQRIEQDVAVRSEAAAEELDHALHEYLDRVERSLVTMERGGSRKERAGVTDDLYNSFSKLDRHLEEIQLLRQAQSGRAASRARVLSIVTLALVLAVLVGLTRRYQREISDRKQAALADSEARFRALIDDNSDLVLSVDRHGVTVDASRACQHVLGVSGEEVVGRPLAAFVHPDDFVLLAAASAAAERPTIDWRMRHGNGY
jgi:PAS domain-containing protein